MAERGTDALIAVVPPRRGHFDDPLYYDKAYRRRVNDVAFYRALGIARRGPVLEYGVGNGRVALPLARAGVEVVGIDSSRPMLRDLRTKLESEPDAVRRRVRWRVGDMRKKRLRQRFPLVIAPFNVVLHLLTERDFARFLDRVRAHLAPHGRLVFDFSMPHVEDLALPADRWYGAPSFKDPASGKLVRYQERFDYDPLTQLLRMTFRFSPVDGSPSWETDLVHRQWFPRELAALLRHHGFSRQRWSADFERRKADREADSLIVECRADARGKVL